MRLQGAAFEVGMDVGEDHLVAGDHNTEDEGEKAPVGDINAAIRVCMQCQERER